MPDACPTCKGSGYVPGIVSPYMPCPRCTPYEGGPDGGR